MSIRGSATLPLPLRLLLFVLAGVASYFLLLRAHPPYLWIAGTWIVLSALFTLTSVGWRHVAWFNLCAVLAILGAGEFFCWRESPGSAIRTDTSAGYVTSHEFLGNAPLKNSAATVTRYDHSKVLYRVAYTINGEGWRATPWQGERDQDAGLVAFFGCSLTFGEGVQDSETLPAQVSFQSQGRLRSFNFGFSGYGPHQMLAILDHHLEAASFTHPPVMAIYQAIPGHVFRALGRTTWDPGPRYIAQSDGSVRFAGRFYSPRTSKALNILYRSFLLHRLFDQWNSRLGSREYALYFGIVQGAKREFQARYPGSEFVVIYWDNDALSPERRATDRLILDGFASRGIRAIPVSRMLPGYPKDYPRYVLSPDDPHPNALAYRALANYLVEVVLPAPGR